ncbi:hypothetical protein H0O02_00610 [Candidatus Micrarchaeota archaeon]|nr:hypothetical protein [Candidatus Micrarchaeota archaeon]
MKLHIVLVLLMFIATADYAFGSTPLSSYQLEKPWDYATWRCSGSCDVYGVIACESKSVTVADWPYVYYVSCNCDEDGCSSCPMCGRTTRTFRLSSLGYARGAWGIDEFESALDQLELEKVFAEKRSLPNPNNHLSGFVPDYENYSVVINNLNSAYTYRTAALDYASRCKSSGTYSAHDHIVNHGFVCSSEPISMTFDQYRAIMAPGGVKASYPCTASDPTNPAGTYCKGYYSQWSGAVARAFDALTASFSYANSKIETQARPLWNRMNKSGICDDDYTWDAGEGCDGMQSAFPIIDRNASEGTYGQYNSAKTSLLSLKNSSWRYPPELRNYTRIMKLLWQKENGTIPLFTKLVSNGNVALERAENTYAGFIGSANGYKRSIDTKYSEMESEKISQIGEAVAVGHIEQESIGSIAERFATFKESRLEAAGLLSNATAAHGRISEQGYLKKATRGASDANQICERLAGSADRLLIDAETAVSQQREQTLAILNQAKSTVDSDPSNMRAKQSYQQAKALFDRGEASSILGEKFDYYVRAESYAWQALQQEGVVTNESSELLLQAEDLIRRAEMDEISVESEKMLLGYLEGEQDSRDISAELRPLVAGILNKADIKYGHLLDFREELLENISSSGGCGDDLAHSVEIAERGIVRSGMMDYMNGIGRLKMLEASYQEIAGELAVCESSMIANSLIISESLNIGRVKIDEPVHARLVILISNPTYYSGEVVTVNVPLDADLPLLYSDITEGRENIGNVIAEEGNLLLTLNKIGPYWTRSVTFEKDAVLAHTLEAERRATGLGDEKARVEETRRFDVDAGGVYIDLSSYGGSSGSATIDGGDADAVLSRGEHTLLVSYVADDAYSVNRSGINAVQVGLNTQLDYRISVMPAMDIESLPLTLDIEYGNVSGISISALSGATISSEECGEGYCEIGLSGLEEGDEALVSVSYLILNTDVGDASAPLVPEGGYCIEGLEKECDSIPATISQTLAMINAANERGDYASAIELKERLKDEIERWRAAQQSLADDYEKLLAALQNEKSEIDSALGIAGSANDSLVDSMKSRKAAIENALAEAEAAVALSDAVAALERPDPDWKADAIKGFQESSWNDYNSLKKRLFEAGVTTMPQEFLVVESRMNALAASNSLTDAVQLLLGIAAAENLVNSAEAAKGDAAEELRESFIGVKDDIIALLETYRGQQDEAKGTPWEGMFTVDSAGVESAVDEIESMFGSEDSRFIEKKMGLLEKKKEKIVQVLEQLASESETLFSTVRDSFTAKKNNLPQDVAASMESGLEDMAGLIADQKYISALKAGKLMLEKLEGYENGGGGVNPVLVALAVLAVAAAGGVYYYRYKRGGSEGGLELPFLKKAEKEYKQLERAEQ